MPEHGAIYHVVGRDAAFDYELPPVPVHSFTNERIAAFSPLAGSRIIDLDMRSNLGCSYAATTPAMLASYIVLQKANPVVYAARAGAEVYYVIEGRGRSTKGGHSLEWAAGDVFCLNGDAISQHSGHDARAILFCCSDAPLFSFLGAGPAGLPSFVHYPAAHIADEMHKIFSHGEGKTSWPVQLTSAAHQNRHAATPTLTVGLNPLEPGRVQAAHRHSAAALTLCIQGEGFSQIGAIKVPWEKFGVSLTPPLLVHSHHNVGKEFMINLTIQDAGLHFQLRTMAFTPFPAGKDTA